LSKWEKELLDVYAKDPQISLREMSNKIGAPESSVYAIAKRRGISFERKRSRNHKEIIRLFDEGVDPAEIHKNFKSMTKEVVANAIAREYGESKKKTDKKQRVKREAEKTKEMLSANLPNERNGYRKPTKSITKFSKKTTLKSLIKSEVLLQNPQNTYERNIMVACICQAINDAFPVGDTKYRDCLTLTQAHAYLYLTRFCCAGEVLGISSKWIARKIKDLELDYDVSAELVEEVKKLELERLDKEAQDRINANALLLLMEVMGYESNA